MSIFETESFQSFKSSLSSNGAIYKPDDSAYETARLSWNFAYTDKPSMIIWCATAEDVSAAVKFLSANKLDFTVAGGRHSRFCLKENVAQINLGGLNRVHVDPEKKVVYAQGGARNGELDVECGKYCLHTPAGTNPDTGLGGLILGGGYGFISTTYGFCVDNLIEAEIVTADGKILKASEQENADLFWGIRGAGFNFGIVTQFTLRVHHIGHIERPLTEVENEIITKYNLPDQSALVNKIWGGLCVYPFPQAKAVLTRINNLVCDPNFPKDTMIGASIMHTPHGDGVGTVLSHYGPNIYEGTKIVAPLRGENSDLKPIMDMVNPITYVELQKLLEAKQAPGFYNERAVMVGELTSEIIDILLEEFSKRPSSAEESYFVVLPFHAGAKPTTDPNSTSLAPATRNSRFWIAGVTRSEGTNAEPGLQWIIHVKERLRPFATAYYINNISGDDSVTALFPQVDHYNRLRALKTKFDPQNIFHNNNNILPL